MPNSKPIQELCDSSEISNLCHRSGEPVYLMDDGEPNLVVMSLEHYEQLQARLALYRLLDRVKKDGPADPAPHERASPALTTAPV